MTEPGRNDPCLCGSGKKYKKCCLGKYSAQAQKTGQSVQELYSTQREKMPVLLNYDGDPAIFCKAYFTALNKDSITAVLNGNKDIEFDKDTKRWDWLAPGTNRMGGNTIIGTIYLEKDLLVFETNSIKRAEKFRKFAEKSLNNYVSYVKIDAKDISAVPELSEAERKKSEAEQMKLMSDPEIQKVLQQKMDDYYFKRWIRQKIPALGHITPIEAAKTGEGRKLLNTLINDIESNQNTNKTANFKVDMLKLRKILKLK